MNREALLDKLRGLIEAAKTTGETDFAIGRSVQVRVNTLPWMTAPELTTMLRQLENDPVLQDLEAKVGWAGSREDGETVIVLSHKQ